MEGKGKSIAAFLSLVFLAIMAGVFLESGEARASHAEFQSVATDIAARFIEECDSDFDALPRQ
jgi:hypothetical protein